MGRLDSAARLAIAQPVLADAIAAAVDALTAEAGGPAWDEAGFARLRDAVAGSLAERTLAIVDEVVRILDAAREVEQRLEPLTPVPLQPARADVREPLRPPGFPRLPDP